MGMLDKTDIDFDSSDAALRKVTWRAVKEDDLVHAALQTLVIVGLLIYGVFGHLHDGVKLYVLVVIWLFLVYFQVQRFMVLYRKYRSGGKIMAGMFVDVRKNKE